jgi:hypothetical protein
MKTRNWKLCTLVIFLAVCFALYAGNCYSQEPDPGDWFLIDDNMHPPIRMPDSWEPPSLKPWYSVPTPMPLLGIDSSPWPPVSIGPIYPMQELFGSPWGFGYWGIPAGETTLDLFKEMMPQLTYEKFYNMEDFHGIENLYDDYYGSPDSAMDNWTLYQRTDLYTRSKAGEHTLYQFTKEFKVKPRRPDLYTTYGMGGSYAGIGGLGMLYGGLGSGWPGAFGSGYGISAGYAPRFGGF